MELTNHFLVANPKLNETPFRKAVIFLCQHDRKGAMGLIINHTIEPNLGDLFIHMEISVAKGFARQKEPIFAGGPVQIETGYVLHSPPGHYKSSTLITDQLALTTSKDVLVDIADNKGPSTSLIALGYAAWREGQLERELANNDWFVLPANDELLFSTPISQRWSKAMQQMGYHHTYQLTYLSGHA